MKKVLIISHDKVGPSMAGPGIRYHQIATELIKHFSVTLATFNPSYIQGLKSVPYSFISIDANHFQKDFSQYDVIFALWLSPEMIEYAKLKKKVLIFDLYAPVPVEDLVAKVYAHKTTKDEAYNYAVSIKSYANLFRNGDYFVCSNPIQQDFWVGYGFASESVSPRNYDEFPIYDRVGLLPMGIDLAELDYPLSEDPIRKKFPAIKKKDFVLVWTGGIWDWFDAETPIKAVKALADKGIHVKLVFLGTKHPNKDVPEMSETAKAYTIAKELNLINTHIFFLEGWIEYKKRIGYLRAADAAIYAHKPSVEARYSHRTRVLDHFLMCLPTIATNGDYLADIVHKKQLGLAVEPLNIQEMQKAIFELVTDREKFQQIKNNIKNEQQKYTWQATTQQLVEFINESRSRRPAKTITITEELNPKIRKLKKLVPKPVKKHMKRYLAN